MRGRRLVWGETLESGSADTESGSGRVAWIVQCDDVSVPKVRTTLTIDEDLLRAVRARAARSGKSASEVIEDAVREVLGLDLLRRIWEKADLSEDDAATLAVEAQHGTRPPR
jgi:plasmid stability protein